jgi:hypothetical protein
MNFIHAFVMVIVFLGAFFSGLLFLNSISGAYAYILVAALFYAGGYLGAVGDQMENANKPPESGEQQC